MKPSLKLNVLASFAGRSLNGVLAFVFVPLYIRLLGMESYGLIGFFATLSATLNLLDLGLSSTLNRQLASLSALPETGREQRDLVRSLESVYWLIAISAGLLLWFASPYVARYWVNAQNLPLNTVTLAISLIGLVFVFQFPFGLYQGGLMGLQRHVKLNGILAVMGVVRNLGAVGVLVWISPTLQAYFIWQFICSAAQTVVIRTFLWNALPPSPQYPRFRLDSLKSIWRFAAGMTGIAVVSIILTNLDKVLLSKMLPLSEFGYYMAGSSVASCIFIVVSPFFVAAFPRFTQMIAAGRQEELARLYHLLCQTITCVVWPVAAVIAFFSPQVILIWSHNPELVEHASLIVTLLIIGTGLNAMVNIPYALQLASGWTSFAFYQNVISIILLVPLLLVLIHYFGAVGAAMNWVILHIGYILISPHVMHTRLLPSEKYSWYFRDMLIPGSAIVATSMAARLLLPIDGLAIVPQLMLLGTVWLLALLAGILLSPNVRVLINEQWHRIQKYRACQGRMT